MIGLRSDRLDLAFGQFPFIPVASCNSIAWLATTAWQQPRDDKGRPSCRIYRRGRNHLPNLEAMIWHTISSLILWPLKLPVSVQCRCEPVQLSFS